MAEGSSVLRIPFNPALWRSVNGKYANSKLSLTREFYDCVTGPVQVGIVFGGGLYYAHGLFMSQGTGNVRVRRVVVT
jgi:hypothetical protein